MKKIFFFILCVILFSACNADSITVNTNRYKGKGTVHFANNAHVIDSDDGRKFLPQNLSDDFKIHNLRVEFEGTIEKNNSVPPNLEVINITSIKRI